MADFNDVIMQEFHANGGRVETAGFGTNLVLLHTIGARTGAERVSPVRYFDGGDGTWLVVASKAGAPDNPAWYANLLAHPDEVSIEVGDGTAIETVPVTATRVGDDEYADVWAGVVREAPGFDDYRVKAAPRVIPVVRLTRR